MASSRVVSNRGAWGLSESLSANIRTARVSDGSGAYLKFQMPPIDQTAHSPFTAIQTARALVKPSTKMIGALAWRPGNLNAVPLMMPRLGLLSGPGASSIALVIYLSCAPTTSPCSFRHRATMAEYHPAE